MRICIDPGHGGHDAGACHGTRREKDYTLRLGLRVAEIVRAKGHVPVLTRSADTALGGSAATDLAARCRIASGCDATLSIHLNSAAAVATGLEVLFETERNRGLAQAVLDELLKVAPIRNRGVKVQKLGALPDGGRAVLAEMGFINNPSDVKVLETNFEGYCQALVRGLFHGLGLAWKEEEEVKEITDNMKVALNALADAGVVTKASWEGKLGETASIGEIMQLLAAVKQVGPWKK